MMELKRLEPSIPRAKIDWATLERLEPEPPEWQRYDAARDALADRYGDDEVFSFHDLMYDLEQARAKAARSSTDLYYATAGEIEARDTAKRAGYTAEERKNTRPDIDQTDVVFANDDQSFSIEYTTQNEPVAVIDEDILLGIPKAKWVETVKNTIHRKFSGGIPVSGRLIKVNKITRNEYTNSKDSQWNRWNERTIYKDKYKSANNLDDIVLASTNYINEDLKHSRKDTFSEFARGDVLIKVGKNNYRAKVIVGFTTGKSMVLYDVIDFTPTDFEIKKKDTHTVQSLSEKNSRHRVTYKDSIRNNNENVNDFKQKNHIDYSLREITPLADADYKKAEDFFGTTRNYNVAGYLLPDGKMLDFSGRHWGDTSSDMRTVDHRDMKLVATPSTHLNMTVEQLQAK